jgi:hypothetical protein
MMPKIQKRKQFPFFSLPEPKFLTRKLKKIDDFVVLVRVTPDISIFNYIDSIIYLLFFVFASLTLLFSWLAYALSKAPSLLFTFLWHDWWMLFASVYTGYRIPSRLQIYADLFGATLVVFVGSFWVVSQTRRTLRDFRALRKMHTMTEAERKEFSLQRFLRVSLPMWLSYSVNYEPTPEELLTLLREREKATEQQTQDIAATLEDTEEESEQEEQPSFSMLLTLTSSLALSLIAPGDRRVTIALTDAIASLVGFLATRTKGIWTTKEELFKQVYDPGKESAFAMHRKRANDQVITRAQAVGFFPQKEKEDTSHPSEDKQSSQNASQIEAEDEDTAQENEEHRVPDTEAEAEIELFKNQIQGQISSWQLTNNCNIEVFPFLTDFYHKVVAAQALPLLEAPASLSLEQLRQGCHHVIEEYGEGFLASHMKKGYVWSWALPLYKQYREQCLFILAYANQREREHLDTCQTRSEKYEVVEHIAQLYGWQAAVAAGLDLKDGGVSSEQDMERCLTYYEKVKKKSAARATYHRYCELRSRSNFAYEPGTALKNRAEEVLFSKGKTARSRQAEKEVL